MSWREGVAYRLARGCMSLVTSALQRFYINLLKTSAVGNGLNPSHVGKRMRVLLGRWSRALWLGAFLVSSTGLALAQGSRQTSEFDAIEERDRDNPKARDQWFMRGRTAPNGESAALRFRAYQQKLQMRKLQFAARSVTAAAQLFAGWAGRRWAPLHWRRIRGRGRTMAQF